MASVNSFSPTSAPQGQTVNIVGTGFLNAADVFFGADGAGNGGVRAASFVIVDDSHINAVVSAGATGGVSVWGRSGVGAFGGFTYLGSAIGTGAVTQSQGVLTFTDTTAGITVTSRILQVFDSNGNILTTINMGSGTTATYTIMTDQYLTFVCTINNGVAIITVNWLSTYFYQVAFAPLIAAIPPSSCDTFGQVYNLNRASWFFNSAVTFAQTGQGVNAQANITQANFYLTTPYYA